MAIDTASLLRDARHRARTAQSAVAAYETGARKPSLATLERLLAACDHDADLVARPRMRRGAAPLANLATTIRHDLAGGEERNAIRLLFGFADDFRGSSRPGRQRRVETPIARRGRLRRDQCAA